MRRIAVCCAIIMSLAEASLAEDFEGIIHSTGTIRGNHLQAKFLIKGKKGRMEVISSGLEPIVYIYDVERQIMLKLDPAKKLATGPFPPDLDAVAAGRKTKAPPLIKTGKTETIAGYPAEQYTRTYDDGRVTEFWSTTSIKMSREVALGMFPFVGQFARDDMYALEEPGAIELRKVSRLADGSVWLQKEVTRVERISLSDDLFVVPADYQLVDTSKTKAPTSREGHKDDH